MDLRPSLLAFCTFLFPVFATAQLALEYDINQQPAPSEVGQMIAFDGQLFFSADNGFTGAELWRYDPVGDELFLVGDIYPFELGSQPTEFEPYDGRLFFAASDGVKGNELWAYDPALGTAGLVADIRSGSLSSFPSFMAVYNSKLYFTAEKSGQGRELWSYDAATDMAELVVDLIPGSTGSQPGHLAVYNGKLYFSGTDGNTGYELWSYDSSTGQAQIVADQVVGSGSFSPGLLTVFNNTLFFSAVANNTGEELWRYNGTNIAQVADIWTGGPSSNPTQFTELGGKLYFVATNLGDAELYVYDPSTGVQLAANINPTGSSFPATPSGRCAQPPGVQRRQWREWERGVQLQPHQRVGGDDLRIDSWAYGFPTIGFRVARRQALFRRRSPGCSPRIMGLHPRHAEQRAGARHQPEYPGLRSELFYRI
ncbi:MAG: hypothetical protein IPH04_02960 [Saprospirales bacterium]|nr:hypothetical protein [Saprospirales bacterium]